MKYKVEIVEAFYDHLIKTCAPLYIFHDGLLSSVHGVFVKTHTVHSFQVHFSILRIFKSNCPPLVKFGVTLMPKFMQAGHESNRRNSALNELFIPA